MAIGTGTPRNAKGASQFLGSPVDLRLRAPVEDLDDVDLTCDPLDCLFPEVAPARVIRVLQVDQSTLVLDRFDSLFGGQPAGHGLLQEEGNEFSLGGQDLLTDDDRLAGFEERLGAGDAFVVSQEYGGEAHLATAPRP